jgi:hypothetical protein
VLIHPMRIPTGGVRLPDLDQRVRDRPPAVVEHASLHDDALAERLADVLARQIAVACFDAAVRIGGPRQLGQRLRNDNEGLFRMPQRGAPIPWPIVGRMCSRRRFYQSQSLIPHRESLESSNPRIGRYRC